MTHCQNPNQNNIFFRLLRVCLVAVSCVLLMALLSSCGSEDDQYKGMTPVVYELEGANYRNCERAVTQYYAFPEGETSFLIRSLTDISGEEPTMIGYTLSGWYRTKTVSDGVTVYSDPWDFSVDRVGREGVTLYAKWVKNATHTYEICYLDETTSETVVLGSYPTEEGEAFNPEYISDFSYRAGYTPLDGAYDRNGDPWSEDFRHPGGEDSVAVQVYLHYIPGEYSIVHNPTELKRALTSNIYLACDIDFEGATFGGFKDYRKELVGNGYAIKNFSLTYADGNSDLVTDTALDEDGDKLLLIGIFRNLTGAVIRDVSFENVTVDLATTNSKIGKILVSPFAIGVSGATLSGVSASVTVTKSELPKDFDEANLKTPATGSGWFTETDSDTDSITFSLTVLKA